MRFGCSLNASPRPASLIDRAAICVARQPTLRAYPKSLPNAPTLDLAVFQLPTRTARSHITLNTV